MSGGVFPTIVRCSCVLLVAISAFAHDVPSELPEPTSVPEAWNVLEGSAANVDALLKVGLITETPFQIANAATALRFLQMSAAVEPNASARVKLADSLLSLGVEMILAADDQAHSASQAQDKWNDYRATLKELESAYSPDVLHAAIYVCSEHRQDRHLKANEKCSNCGAPLIRRRLPASAVYEAPVEPTLHLRVDAAPLDAGKNAVVTLHLAHADGSPVTPADLLQVHGQKLSALLNDPALADYRYAIPQPTLAQGEYRFEFTPAHSGPYRLWVGVTPAATSQQEYLIADLRGSDNKSAKLDRVESSTVVTAGRRFELHFENSVKSVRAGQITLGAFVVSDIAGKPSVDLEPFDGNFADLVAFHEDGRTIFHIHPFGRSPRGPADRGGPAFAFKFFTPQAGFLRVYGQVHIGGEFRYVPFGIVAVPRDPLPAVP